MDFLALSSSYFVSQLVYKNIGEFPISSHVMSSLKWAPLGTITCPATANVFTGTVQSVLYIKGLDMYSPR